MTDNICKFLEDLKAEDIRTLDVRGKSSIADTLIIVTGRSTVHNKTLARKLMSSDSPVNPSYNEGMDTCEWIVIVSESTLIHIMTAETRDYYHLEDLWDSDL